MLFFSLKLRSPCAPPAAIFLGTRAPRGCPLRSRVQRNPRSHLTVFSRRKPPGSTPLSCSCSFECRNPSSSRCSARSKPPRIPVQHPLATPRPAGPAAVDLDLLPNLHFRNPQARDRTSPRSPADPSSRSLLHATSGDSLRSSLLDSHEPSHSPPSLARRLTPTCSGRNHTQSPQPTPLSPITTQLASSPSRWARPSQLPCAALLLAARPTPSLFLARGLQSTQLIASRQPRMRLLLQSSTPRA